MARADTVSLTYTADIADLKKKLASIPDITATQARAAVKGLDRELKAMRRQQETTAAATRDAAAAAQNQRMMVQQAAAGILAAGAAFGVMAQDVANARNELSDLSTRSGVARDTLAGLRLAAEGSGLAFSDIEGIVSRLPKIMGDVRRGSKEQADAFKALGVEVTDASGNLRDGDAVFRELVAAIGQLPTPTEKAAAAAQVFGKQGTKLLQALGDPAALDSFVQLAGQSAINSADAAASAGDWQRSMAELNLALDGVKATLVDGLGVTGLVDDFTLGLTFMTAAVQSLGEEFARVGRVGASVFSNLAAGEFMAAGRAADQFANELLNPIERISDLNDALTDGFDAAKTFKRLRDETRAAAAATAELTAAIDTQTEAEHRSNASRSTAANLEKERIALQRQQVQASEKLADIESAARMAQLEGEPRINAIYVQRMQQIAELEQLSGNHAAANAARAEVEAQHQGELFDHRQSLARAHADEQDRLREERIAKEQAADAEIQAGKAAMYSAISSLSSTTANALLAHSQQLSEENKAAAIEAFNAYKAVSIAQASISAAAGAVRALSDYPYPYSLIVAAAVAAQGAIQVATIAAQEPSFADTPGIQRAGNQGMTASFAPGDLVVAGRDESDLVRQMQRAGIGMGSSEVLIRDTDRHHGRYGRDPMRPPERYDTIKRRAGRTPGRR